MAKVIGITGGIACGKTTLTRYLQKLGYIVLDSDLYARDTLKEKTILEKVLERHPEVKVGETIDRRLLGNIVFHQTQEKAWLESLIHPYVIQRLEQGILFYAKEDVIFLDIPLLYEIHLESLCDEVIVVYVDEKTQIERLMMRDRFSQEEALMRIHQQLPLHIKKQKADVCFNNQGTIEAFYRQIEDYLQCLRKEIYERKSYS